MAIILALGRLIVQHEGCEICNPIKRTPAGDLCELVLEAQRL